MLCQQANPRLFFLLQPCPKTANASQSGVAKATIFFTTPSSQTMVSPAAALQLRYSFIFFD
jgi:hypothetical protein